MNSPNPYEALRRILALRPAQQRGLLRLEVWCDASRHTPLRVFKLREGILIQCRSDADVRDMKEQHPHLSDWSRRRAFFLEEWLTLDEDPQNPSHLQVVCGCAQVTPRLVDVERLANAIPADDSVPTRRIRLPDVAAEIR